VNMPANAHAGKHDAWPGDQGARTVTAVVTGHSRRAT
jgi:hypothetical protein